VKGRLDLLVPGLFGPVPLPPEDLPAVPALARLLGRADRSDTPVADPLTALASRFGIRAAPGGDLPSAPYCRLADDPGTDPSGYWMHADPVHLRPDRDQLLLFDARHLGLGQTEADRLTAELNAHFAPDGLRFEAPIPDRWYLRLESPPRVRTSPLHAVAGRGLGPFLPSGEDGPAWIRLLNEAQMLLHHSEVNRAREREGRPAVSGIWPWGGGRAQAQRPEAGYEAVHGGHPFLVGLAQAAGIPVRAMADGADAPIPRQPREARLVFWDALWPAVLDADAGVWSRELVRLDRLVQVLLAGLRDGRVGRVDLDACDGGLFRLTPMALRRFWRRAPAFGDRLSRPG
jgi:hypothetical protein